MEQVEGYAVSVLESVNCISLKGKLNPIMQAAGVLAALASAEHSSAAKLLNSGLSGLTEAAANLALACGPEVSTNSSAQACSSAPVRFPCLLGWGVLIFDCFIARESRETILLKCS